jgi:NAD(P)-dependent dehydrogenase (short-subunit alcohol dehydrogenase family)
MPEIVDAAKLLRDGVLDGLGVLVADAGGAAEPSASPTFAALIASACVALGASVERWSVAGADTADWSVPDSVDRLIIDGAALYDAGERAERAQDEGSANGDGSSAAARAGLRACLDSAWVASHAVANAAFIERRRPGRIVYVAPPSAAGASAATGLADAARAGLENLARTLSIEWARYEITTATIAPGVSTSGDEVAALCAYLASPAGAYFSGCLLDLRGIAARRTRG